MRIHKYGFLVACVGLALYPAMVQASDVLTEEKIKAFYDESLVVQMKTIEETLAFYDKHMHKDAKATLNLVSRVKGTTTDKKVFEFDKEKLMSETQKGHDMSKLKSIEGSVISSKVSDDGKSAKVKSSFVSMSTARVPVGGKMISVNIEQSALCDDEIIMSENDVILYMNSTCNAESVIDLPAQ